MRKLLYFIVAVAAIGAIAWYVYTRGVWQGMGGGVPTDVTNSYREPARVSWRGISQPQDGFSIDMPSDTSQIQVPAYNAQGDQEQMEMLVATPNAETTYALAWDDNPPVVRASGQVAERTLDHARNGALARTQTTLTGESSATYMGYPERNFSARNANGGLLDARLILAGTKLYMMIAAFPAESARRDRDVNHFFDSFKLAAGAR